MSFADFMQTAQARTIAPLLDSATVLERMEELSRTGVPAVAALDRPLAAAMTLTNTEKQYVGRWVREVLASRGWRPLIQRRLAGGKLFSSGTVYRRTHDIDRGAPARQIPVDLLSVADRIRQAQAMVKTFGDDDYSVDDFIREKWTEADGEEPSPY